MSTIEERAEKAWEDYEYRESSNLYRTCFKHGYTQGATEALLHQWISVDDALPDKQSCECICHDGERVFFARWLDETPHGLSGWDIAGMAKPPIAWMHIPPLPEVKK